MSPEEVQSGRIVELSHVERRRNITHKHIRPEKQLFNGGNNLTHASIFTQTRLGD